MHRLPPASEHAPTGVGAIAAEMLHAFGYCEALTADLSSVEGVRAPGIILTGRNVSAPEGLAPGFVNEVVPRSEPSQAALRWACRIADCAPLATRCNKPVACAGRHRPDFVSMMDPDDYSTVRPLLESEDAIEGTKVFLERRRPVWKGR